MNALMLGHDIVSDFESSVRREWLVTNGVGGFASGTLCGANTRRYHGMLVAALHPPLGRTVMVSSVQASVSYRDHRYELATNEYADGTIAPRGYVHLQSFRLEGQIPVWEWQLGDATIEQRVWMAHGENTSFVEFRVLQASDRLRIDLEPLCTYRDYHSHRRGEHDVRVTELDSGLRVEPSDGARPYRILTNRGSFHAALQWHWNVRHRAEADRGLDDVEDLFRPGAFSAELTAGESVALTLTTETTTPARPAVSLENERMRQAKVVELAAAPDSAPILRQIALAADQFVVARHSTSTQARERAGTTLIAGYPWFGDWGRDTMIALPGIAISTGRPEIAASILRTFSRFVSEGMLPNRFPDAGEAPEYNTVDATLWYFVAIHEYVRHTGDRALLAELFDALRSIVRWHQRGTRYGIEVDPRDGLLRAGVTGSQLTWMDAKIGDWVVTPRIGKPVEVNALWFNALAIMRDFAALLDDKDGAREYASAAERVARSFDERFWYESGRHLYDVIDGPDGDDASLRPNQIFAVSLPHPLLDNGRAKAVVDAVQRELWTPVGLRSLASTDARYAGRYVGGPRERDAVYHQGTVWSWLLGPFVSAHYRMHGDATTALHLLSGLDSHLREGCIGQVSEIFDGDPPFTPRGCFAQAWSVAELLRAWSEINGSEGQDGSAGRARRSSASRAR